MSTAMNLPATTNPARVVYRVAFWVEANDYSFDAYLTPDEASVVLTRLGENEDFTDLSVWTPTAALDGPDELFDEINDLFDFDEPLVYEDGSAGK